MTNLPHADFIPTNSLEQRLVEAATDVGARPAFYRELLESDVFVPGFTEQGGEGETVVKAGDNVSIAHWQDQNGAPYVPVFSSMQRMQQAITEKQNYLRVNARSLLEIVEGIQVVLNPGAPYGKEFTSEEISRLLDGSIFKGTQRHIVEQEQQVMLGQPSVYPQKLVDALKSLFAQHKTVESAHLAHIFNATSGEPPHTIIGIKAAGDISGITADAGMVAGEVLARHEIVDFIQMGTDNVSSYMLKSTEPFYVRQ